MINKIPLLDDFVEYKRALNIREKTILEYTDAVDKFISFYLEYADKSHLTRYSYKTITTQDMQTYLFKLRESLSVSSVRKYFAGISQFFTWLKVNKFIEVNPITGVQMQKDKEKHQHRSMTYEESVKLIECTTSNRNKLILSIMGYMGLRIEEVCSLELKNINFDNNSIYFRRKTQKFQTLPIRKSIVELMKEQYDIALSKGHVYLFQSPDGVKPMTTNAIRDMFNKHLEIAGLSSEYTPHMMRKSFSTYLFQDKGLMINEIQVLLGHSSPITKLRYIDVNNDKLLDKFARMDD